MKYISYSDMVRGLSKDGIDIIDDLTPQKAHLWHMASCIMGEAGELFDAIKKYSIYDKDVDIENVVEELGDIEFYMEGLRQSFNITRESTLKHNEAKLTERYKEGSYSNEQAKSRKDKDRRLCSALDNFSKLVDFVEDFVSEGNNCDFVKSCRSDIKYLTEEI